MRFIKDSQTIYNSTTGVTYAVCKFVCDTISDLPTLNSYSSFVLQMGCEAHVIENGKDYMMKSDGTWVEQPSSGGGGGGTVDAYTKEETDELLDERIPYNIDGTIQSGDDLDYYYNVGTWEGPATGIDHSPTDSSFRLDVVQLRDSDRIRQIVQPLGSGCRRYERNALSYPSETTTALIPAMTSDTAPSGTVIYSGVYSTRYAWLAFDGVDSQTWRTNAWGDGTNALDGLPETCYVGYEFTESKQVNSYDISFSSDRVYVGIIQTRNNNVWTTQATVTIPNNGYNKVTGRFDTTVTCDAVRFSVLSGTGTYFCASNYGGVVCEFQVYFVDDKPTWSDWVRRVSDRDVDLQVFGSGTSITSGADLNDYKTTGVYKTPSSAIARSCSNAPDFLSTGSIYQVFRLEVFAAHEGQYPFQKMYVTDTASASHSVVKEYIRSYTGYGWGSWYQIGLTAVNNLTPQLSRGESIEQVNDENDFSDQEDVR